MEKIRAGDYVKVLRNDCWAEPAMEKIRAGDYVKVLRNDCWAEPAMEKIRAGDYVKVLRNDCWAQGVDGVTARLNPGDWVLVEDISNDAVGDRPCVFYVVGDGPHHCYIPIKDVELIETISLYEQKLRQLDISESNYKHILREKVWEHIPDDLYAVPLSPVEKEIERDKQAFGVPRGHYTFSSRWLAYGDALREQDKAKEQDGTPVPTNIPIFFDDQGRIRPANQLKPKESEMITMNANREKLIDTLKDLLAEYEIAEEQAEDARMGAITIAYQKCIDTFVEKPFLNMSVTEHDTYDAVNTGLDVSAIAARIAFLAVSDDETVEMTQAEYEAYFALNATVQKRIAVSVCDA